MKAYLVFRLYGAMASWGQAAVGGDRPTGLHPSRSAILGLLGAALGIKSDDTKALDTLQNSVKVAVKQCAPSSLLRDYHTTQVPSHNKKVTHYTRRSELLEDKQNTVLSSRDYRCDGLWVIAISAIDSSHYDLTTLQQALLKPHFPLSLGRKACPPSAPLMPQIIQTANLKSALDHPFPPLSKSEKSDQLRLSTSPELYQATYFWEGNADEIPSQHTLTTHPWHEPLNRERWQFKQITWHQTQVSTEEA